MINYYRANVGLLNRAAVVEPVRVPTLMIWGEHDTALGLEMTEGYDGLVDDWTLVRLPQASHWVQQDAPDAVNAAMRRWLGDKIGSLA